MSAPHASPSWRDPLGIPTFAVLAVVLLALGVEAIATSPLYAILVIVLGLAVAGALRVEGKERARPYLLIPVGVTLGFASVIVAITVANELLVGAAALAGLAWLADGREGSSGSVRRAVELLLVPALGLGIAVGGSLLLPPGELRLGIASLLLAAALVLIAVVLARPESLRGAAAPTSSPPPSS